MLLQPIKSAMDKYNKLA